MGALFRILLLTWASLAIYYSHLPWPWVRVVLALAFLAFGIWALWVDRRSRSKWAFAALFLGVVAWWISIRPSHYRPWRPEVAVMPRAFIDGDHVRISGHPTICPAPLPVHLDGSMKHRDHIERGFIGRGMRLMFSRPEEGLSVTTSEIVSLRIIPGGSSERRSEGGRGAP